MKNRAIEWAPLPGEENVWVLRCGRCGTQSERFIATGEHNKAAAFQDRFERGHEACPPSGHTPDQPVRIGPF